MSGCDGGARSSRASLVPAVIGLTVVEEDELAATVDEIMVEIIVEGAAEELGTTVDEIIGVVILDVLAEVLLIDCGIAVLIVVEILFTSEVPLGLIVEVLFTGGNAESSASDSPRF